MSRADKMADFVAGAGLDPANIRPLAADASFRQYFRVDGQPARVLMDAPPSKEEIVPFLAVAQHLNSLGFSAPRSLTHSIDHGFLLSEDLGDGTFTRLLDAGALEADLYRAAVDVLLALHRQVPPAVISITDGPDYVVPPYDDDALLAEVCLLTEWYLTAWDIRPPENALADYRSQWLALFDACRVGDDVLVLRDYHVDNLMMMDGRTGLAQVGLLDFQDALIGPAAYDLVSLLQDCRHHVPLDIEASMIDHYLDARPALDQQAFRTAYTIMGAQRNTKIIGIFTRLWDRDGKPAYVHMIPYLWDLMDRTLGDPVLSGVRVWMDQWVPMDLRRRPLPGIDA
jgi:aminoglycoside/choline kinase family phosphotransferase